MSERSDLLTSIAATIRPYRAGEITAPTAYHVDRWVRQFTPGNQMAFLRAFDSVMKESFITKTTLSEFFGKLVVSPRIVGTNPTRFWKKINFLRVQQNGTSQLDVLDLLDAQLQEELDICLDECGGHTGEYMYLDDTAFTGSRIIRDLELWIARDAPQKARLYLAVAIVHNGGWHYVKDRLNTAIEESGKEIELKPAGYWKLEDRKKFNRDADLLWPTKLPNDIDIHLYAESGQFPFVQRTQGGTSRFFSSEQSRQILESEFLIAGMLIRSRQNYPKDVLRPLGFSRFGVGFGSTIVTYRNCPNTTPLALWWGDGSDGALQWYPLLPRKTYDS